MGRRETYLGERGLQDLLLVDGYSQGGCQLAEVLERFSFLRYALLFAGILKAGSRSRARKDNCAFVPFRRVLRYVYTCWLLDLGFCFALSGGLRHGGWLDSSPFLLSDENARRMYGIDQCEMRVCLV